MEQELGPKVVLVCSAPSVPAGWQCFFDETYRCWYFLSPEEETQWAHPQDGKTYMKHLDATPGTAPSTDLEHARAEHRPGARSRRA